MLQAENITFMIDNNPLIQDISLRFLPGVLYGILGPNGSGKSTLLKNLAGIWQPSSGSVLWKDGNLLEQSREEISRTLTLVPQNPEVHFDFSVREMVAMGRYPFGSSRSAESQDLLEWALETVDAWELRDRSILKLSQGERKRVYIARALITESPVLLLDEPSSSLDIKHQLEIWELLQKLIKQGKTIIVANHDLPATERFCDEAAILHQGRLVCHGKCAAVIDESLLVNVFGVKENASGSAKHYVKA